MDPIAISNIKVTDLPAPPQGALAVVQACGQKQMDAERIAELANQVPALSVELLRLANSAYFGATGEVTSVARAITLIGHRALRNIALCIAIKGSLTDEQVPVFPLTEFWEASLRRAVCCHLLSAEEKLDADTAFTVGLLQDFGLLVMFYLHPESSSEWPRLSEMAPDARYEAEYQLFSSTHDQIGYQLAQAWSLPSDLQLAMGYHHQGPAQDANELEQSLCKLAQCSDWMASVFTSADPSQALRQCRRLLSDYYGLSAEPINLMLQAVSEHMQEAAMAFGFEVGDQLAFDTLIGEANLNLVQENLSFQQMNWHLEHTLEERDRLASELNQELDLAREVQRSLLPSDVSAIGDIVGLNVSAKQVSGDFYDYFRLSSGKVAFCIADVSGKGMNAALLMAKTSSLFHCLGKGIQDPAKLLTMLNREICETSIHGMFVTMLAGVLNPDTGEVVLSNAGHLPALLMQGQSRLAEYPATSPPLGVLPDTRFTAASLTMPADSQLFLYTDGLLEAEDVQGEKLGMERLIDLFGRYKDAPSQQRLQHIVTDVRGLGGVIHDDLTLLMVQR